MQFHARRETDETLIHARRETDKTLIHARRETDETCIHARRETDGLRGVSGRLIHHNGQVRRRPRFFFLLGATAMVAASCTSQETAAPPTPGATSSTTSTTEAPTTTSTTIAVAPEPIASDAPTATSTTEAPTTTLAPPSGQPTTTPTEFFAGGDPDGWLYLGRWSGSGWEQPTGDDGAPLAPATANGTAMFIHEADVAPIAGTAGAAAEACSSGSVGPTISPNARAPEDPGFGYRSIAFAADWPTTPRPSAIVDASIDRYLTNGQTAFSDTAVDATSGAIQQILVTDIDGDGDSESLVAFGGPTYAALILIDADSGSGLTVARSIAEVTTPTTIAGTTETTLEAPAPTIGPFEQFRTLAVADLNGDGFGEFVVHSWESPSSATVTVYTYDGRDVTAVLTNSC